MDLLKKNVLVFGDSYSTFAGFIPKGYETYYSDIEKDETGITQAAETWWHQVCEEANLQLALNNSWSGSTIGYTGYNNSDCSKTSSFIYRWRQLIADGFFDKQNIHTVFVFGGTNDSWSGAPLGEIKFSDFEETDLFYVLPAVCYFLWLVKDTLPQAEIYCLVNTEIDPVIAACLETACERYGVTPVTFDSIDKSSGHPTVQGMRTIKDGVLRAMNQ